MSILSAVTPISGHAVFLLLVQLALLLLLARGGAGLAQFFGLPAVVGELAAGIVLGPSVFGHYAPEAFVALFPPAVEQFHLLEIIGVLGMVLLLLLTGLETDLRLLQSLGRAALVASVLGMFVPFVLGFGLGLWMPDEFLAQPDQRILFAAFLATSMAISAMPVIAKILIDLGLTRRNIGLVILSAGVVDDTAGWLILSVIAGAAAQGGSVELASLAWTIAWMIVFVAAVAVVLYPLSRVAFRWLARAASPDSMMVAMVIIALLAAATTEHIGVHAVFGAFVAGTALRQVPHLRPESVHRLESFVFSILAPVFFGTVGLQVDLWTLNSREGGVMLAIVLAIACVGKLAGCLLGGLWGGMSFWQALSIAVAMNARGAMGLVVATIGLSLGILDAQMFSIIVMVAVVTSFLAPVLLRLTMRKIQPTRDEEARMLAESSRGEFDTSKLRVLVPTAGGPNALVAARVAFGLAARSNHPVEFLYVEARTTLRDRWLRLIGRHKTGSNLDQHVEAIKKLAGKQAMRLRRVRSVSASDAVIEEAHKGIDMILVGASGGSAKIGGPVLEDIIARAPCHVAIVKAGKSDDRLRGVFVPIDGSSVSRLAAEFALHYAQATGAELTLGILSERQVTPFSVHSQRPDTLPGEPIDLAPGTATAAIDASLLGPESGQLTTNEQLARISRVFRVASLEPRIEPIDYDPGLGAVADAIVRGQHTLVVLGAENRSVRRHLFFGHENQRILDLDTVTTTILVPRAPRPHDAARSAGAR